MAKILSIIAPQNYQDIEYGNSKSTLESAGHTVLTASSTEEAHGVFGGVEKVDLLLDNVNVDDFDVILFVGGGGCYDYFEDPVALKLSQDFFKAGKFTTAICAAPSILANAGLLNDVTATCFPSQADHIQEKGANYTGNPVERDGLIITADSPDSATLFGKKIAQALV